MKNIFFLALLLTIVSCSQKDSIVEETQAQINERLDKEQAEKLIIGSWKLYSILTSSRRFADSVGIKRMLTLKENGLAILENKDEKEQYRLDLKYAYVQTEKIGLPRYIFSISDMHNTLILQKSSVDTLLSSSSWTELKFIYVRMK